MPQQDDGFEKLEVILMTKVAIGNIIPDAKVVEKIREDTAKRNRPVVKADKDSWKRSKNKKYLRKMAKQNGVEGLFKHERKKGR